MAKVINKASYDKGHIIREASLIKNLKHPHIPVIYDIYEDDISICIIEEYISGKSLRDFVCESEKMGINQICDIGIKLCNILEYLHNYCGGIIHLDIKPDNIIIDDNNNVKLIDFGNSLYSYETNDQSMLSPGFAAPEQYQGAQPTKRTDIYSVGMVLKFMTDASGFSRVSHKRIYQVIMKCTRHKPELRYRNVQAVSCALQHISCQSGRLGKTKEGNNHSYVIRISGTKRGIGVTHIALSMAYAIGKCGISCVVTEKSGRSDIQAIMLNGRLDENGLFTYKGVHFAADGISYKQQDEKSCPRYKVIIVDEGIHGTDKVNYEDIMCRLFNNYKVINIIVAGGKYGVANECSIINSCTYDTRLMLNLMDKTQYYEYANYIADSRMCYRIPCMYNWHVCNEEFIPVIKDFIQDNMPEIWENIITDLKKEKLGLLYEKAYIIRYKIFKVLWQCFGGKSITCKKRKP